MAPRLLIILGEEKDFFDVRGLEESAGRLRKLYDLLGAPDRFATPPSQKHEPPAEVPERDRGDAREPGGDDVAEGVGFLMRDGSYERQRSDD